MNVADGAAKEVPLPTSDQTFAEDVLAAGHPVLVDFWAGWCAPCRMLGPIVHEIAREYAGRLKVAKVDVDENPGLAARYHIRNIPTLLLFRDGQVVRRIFGYMPKADLKRQIEAAWDERPGTAAADGA